jgi:hypothetical protein
VDHVIAGCITALFVVALIAVAALFAHDRHITARSLEDKARREWQRLESQAERAWQDAREEAQKVRVISLSDWAKLEAKVKELESGLGKAQVAIAMRVGRL